MSGIVAAAQSAGCCCRPSEGCTCASANRPGAVLDRQITAIAVAGEVTVDHAYLNNGSPYTGCGCPCEPIGMTLGTGAIRYGYRPQGGINDPDSLVPGDPCYPGCIYGDCTGCGTYTLSVATSSVVCPQSVAGTAQWSSVTEQVGENFIGQWSWRGRRAGYCNSINGVRVRSFCPFLYAPPAVRGEVDPNGAFVDVNTGEYVTTAYGETVGRLHAVQFARVVTVPTVGGDCGYTVQIGVRLGFSWHILKALAEYGVWPPPVPSEIPAEYVASYFKPCLAPTDTVLGRYELVEHPQYDRYIEDQECGRIRAYEDLRVGFPQFVEVT